MGIKNLTKYLKTNYDNCFKECSIELLKNKTICIDTPCLVYKYKLSGPHWINKIVHFVLKNIENNTDMIFVMEGQAPEEKKSTQDNRKNIREQVNKRTEYLESLLNEYHKSGEISKQLQIEWNKIFNTANFSEKRFQKLLKKRQNYTISVNHHDYNLIKGILDILNISWIQSPNEAETLCSWINCNHKSDFIYSHDSDVLAYFGVNGYINDINFNKKTFIFASKCVTLNHLKMNELEFIEFCILCGTDYNQTIPKFGIKTSHKFLDQHKTLEEMKTHPNFNALNVNFIKKKFTHENSNFSNIQVKYKWPKIRSHELLNFLSEHNHILYKNTTLFLINLKI